MKKNFKRFLATGAVVAVASPSYAAITLPTAVGIADYEALMGLVLTALVAIWAGRKLVKTTNRS